MRALTLSFGVLILAAGPRLAAAGPKAWFDEGRQQCSNPRHNPDGSFECSICGTAFTCSAVDTFTGSATCRWGELEAPNLDMSLLSRGFNLYCEGSGGALLSSASTAAMHAQLLTNLLRSVKRGTTPIAVRSAGGTFEHKSSIAGEAKGAIIPWSWAWRVSELSNLDLMGNVILGFAGELQQYGLNVNPSYTRLLRGHKEEHRSRLVLRLTLPAQALTTIGDQVDGKVFGISWHVGLNAALGFAYPVGRFTFGAGGVVDGRYTNGFTMVTTVATRGSYEFHRLITLAAQVGFSFEPTALSSVGDTMKPVVLAGLEFGSWVLGYQGIFQQGSSSHGIALAYVGAAAEMSQRAAEKRVSRLDCGAGRPCEN